MTPPTSILAAVERLLVQGEDNIPILTAAGQDKHDADLAAVREWLDWLRTGGETITHRVYISLPLAFPAQLDGSDGPNPLHVGEAIRAIVATLNAAYGRIVYGPADVHLDAADPSLKDKLDEEARAAIYEHDAVLPHLGALLGGRFQRNLSVSEFQAEHDRRVYLAARELGLLGDEA